MATCVLTRVQLPVPAYGCSDSHLPSSWLLTLHACGVGCGEPRNGILKSPNMLPISVLGDLPLCPAWADTYRDPGTFTVLLAAP